MPCYDFSRAVLAVPVAMGFIGHQPVSSRCCPGEGFTWICNYFLPAPELGVLICTVLFFFSLVKCMQGNIMYEQFLASVKSCLSSKCFSLALLPLPEQPELHSCLPVVAFKCHKVAATPTLLTEPRRNYKFHLLAGCALFASSSGRGNVQIFRKQIQMW